ncbi:MAG TPA: hypothetical protein VFP91_14820 [Vicinamibacterales bacterium]|nr:hypothetical protein [Vicinamibacterales bacterium]
MIETRTALIYLLDPGIVIVRIKKDLLQTLDDAEKNLSAAIRETGEQRRPLLLDLRQAMPLDDDLRRQYSGPRVVDNFSALGLVVDEGPFGRMMANLYLRVADLEIATQLFATEGDAIAWLLEHRSPTG